MTRLDREARGRDLLSRGLAVLSGSQGDVSW